MNMSMRTMQLIVAGCYAVGVIIVSVIVESAPLRIGLTVALLVGALLTIRYLRHLTEG